MTRSGGNREIFVGRSDGELIHLPVKAAIHHGLVTGATGTGKTITLQILAEGFAQAGISVFATDICGDLAGISELSGPNEEAARNAGYDYEATRFSTVFWDVFGQSGHPMRSNIGALGPILLSQMMELTEVEADVLDIALRIAQEEQLPILDMSDFRAVVTSVSNRFATSEGVHKGTIAKIREQLTVLEREGLNALLGEPQLDISDFMRTDSAGRGVVNVLAADKLLVRPKLYVIVLIWILSELCKDLPSLRDPPQPKLVVFVDEAHLLLRSAPASIARRIPQMLKSLRQKGVGVFFVTSSTADLPNDILELLGNQVHHCQHVLTSAEQKSRTVTDRGRTNPALPRRVNEELQNGEALVSFIRDSGSATSYKRVFVRPPMSRLGTITPAERTAGMAESPVIEKYKEVTGREEAYELFDAAIAARPEQEKLTPSWPGRVSAILKSFFRH